LMLTFAPAQDVIPFTPALFLILPHVAAVYLAWRGHALIAGLAAGAGFWFDPAALFVLAFCLLRSRRLTGRLHVLAGFAAPVLLGAGLIGLTGSLADYWQQVWLWTAAQCSLEWPAGWHGDWSQSSWPLASIGLLVAAGAGLLRQAPGRERVWLRVWLLISSGAAAASAAWGTSGHWFLYPLPILVLLSARGLVVARPSVRWGAAALLVIPAVLFVGPYLRQAGDLIRGHEHRSGYGAADASHRRLTAMLRYAVPEGDTLLVWGGPPALFVYTGISPGTRFLTSGPLLSPEGAAGPAASLAARNRRELLDSRPDWILDFSESLVPAARLASQQDLGAWVRNYRLVFSSEGASLYRLRAPGAF
jgi:hypothetical protein